MQKCIPFKALGFYGQVLGRWQNILFIQLKENSLLTVLMYALVDIKCLKTVTESFFIG